MPPKEQPETRIRRCGVCGVDHEYPLLGVKSTRFHCEDCAALPGATRKILGRMSKRITVLEKENEKLKKKA